MPIRSRFPPCIKNHQRNTNTTKGLHHRTSARNQICHFVVTVSNPLNSRCHSFSHLPFHLKRFDDLDSVGRILENIDHFLARQKALMRDFANTANKRRDGQNNWRRDDQCNKRQERVLQNHHNDQANKR